MRDNSAKIQEYILLKSNYSSIKKEEIRGALSFRDIQQYRNNLIYKLAGFLDILVESDLKLQQVSELFQAEAANGNGRSKGINYDQLKRMSNPEIYAAIDQYKHAISQRALNDEAHYSMGLCYLHLKLYDLAIKQLEKARDLAPDEADYYYYLTLALMRGRRIMTILFPEIKIMEQHLHTACVLQATDKKYDLLLLAIKYDYYYENGLSVQNPTLPEIVQRMQGKKIDAYEEQRLKNTILINSKFSPYIF